MLGPAYDPREPRILSKKEISLIKCGLQTSGSIYLHISLIPSLPQRIREIVEICLSQVSGANILRINRNGKQISFLSYPTFEEEAHPHATREIVMNLNKGTRVSIEYGRIYNRPILLQKERLVAEDYPNYSLFKTLSEKEREYGLLSEAPQMLESKWTSLLSEKGIEIKGHELLASN